MFTGLVEGMGTMLAITPQGPAVRLAIRTPESMRGRARLGESVAINGCCLTAVEIAGNSWSFQAGPETLAKTNLGRLAIGSPVNLERALPADGRLGGHFVQGHVDGVGCVDAIDQTGAWVTMWFRVPEPLARQMVSKGSVAVDGVSLTLVEVERDRFSVALIPHTLEVTTLGNRRLRDEVNVETDILAKYVQKMLAR